MTVMRVVLYILTFDTFVLSLMVMDEESCQEVEEKECGICHTIYMEECRMKMMEEMMPNKVSVCNNVTRYENYCTMEMNYREVEEEQPICEVKMMNKDHSACQEKLDSGLESSGDNCKQVMKCKIGMKKMKKSYPTTVCEDIASGQEEMCVDKVKLKKEKHEEKYCSFHPKTVCQQEEGKECRMVKKKMCNYMDIQE
eukprot:GFUD01077001.1.p1 GENE.GFUD01077001.1~~GFUD01077001.1.p1  ORF type:complete len:197 (-),score=68.35 GFUD01077001.1:173-763(-)